MSWDKSTEGESGGHGKSVLRYLIYCLVVCAQGSDEKQRPAMTQGAHALLTASNTAMQKEERRGGGGGDDYRCKLTPITLILWDKITIIKQSHTDTTEWILSMHE